MPGQGSPAGSTCASCGMDGTAGDGQGPWGPPRSASAAEPGWPGAGSASAGCRARAHVQPPELPSWWFVPIRAAMAGGAGEGSAGVCSGRNRASIDLLLLKPELLLGTLQPGCPRTRLVERTAPCALAWGDSPPKAPGPGAGPHRDQAAAGAGEAPGRQFCAWHLLLHCPAALAPADLGPLGSPGTPRRCPQRLLVVARAQWHLLGSRGFTGGPKSSLPAGMNHPYQEFCPGAFL